MSLSWVDHRSAVKRTPVVRAVRAASVVVGGVFLLSGIALAPALASPAGSAHSPCGGGAAAAVRAVRFSSSLSPSSSSSSSPSASPSSSSSSSPSPSPSSPSPSSSSPSPSDTTSPSPTPTPTPGALCVFAQIIRHESSAAPGGKVTVSVWVWSTKPAQGVTATVASQGRHIRAPRFTVCPTARRTTCSIGSLPANQAIYLVVRDKIGTLARTGEQLTLTVTVQAADMSPAQASIATLVGMPITPTSTPSATTVPPFLPPLAYPTVPGTAVTPNNLSGLFPVVTPSPSPSGSAGAAAGRKPTGITSASSSLPLDPRLIGGQLAGLAVLAAAIAMAVVRLSLRTAGTQGAASAPAPAAPAPADDTPGPTA